jgi:tetratricopeptide (TPR) repeat protein
MKKMKLLLGSLLLFTGSLFSQTNPAPAKSPLDPVITKFNSAAAKVNAGDHAGALAEFDEVIKMADQIGAPANDLKAKAQAQLPVLNYQIGTVLINQKKYEDAIGYLEKSIELSDTYNTPAIKEKANKILPNLVMALGNQKFKEKKYDDAIKYF